jgi:hypothetical protein
MLQRLFCGMAELINVAVNWTPCPSSVVQKRRQANGETEQKQIQNDDTKCSRQLRNSRPIDRENSDHRNASPVQYYYYYYYYCYYRSLPSSSTEQPFVFQNKVPLRSMNSRNKTGDRQRHQNMNQKSSTETTTTKTQKLEAKET